MRFATLCRVCLYLPRQSTSEYESGVELKTFIILLLLYEKNISECELEDVIYLSQRAHAMLFT